MQQWEYIVIEWRGTTEQVAELRLDGQTIDDWEKHSLPELLNEVGTSGWEMVTVYPGGSHVRMVFKRPKEQPA